MSDNNNKPVDIDPSSFASILAGVNKMREDASGLVSTAAASVAPEVTLESSSTTTTTTRVSNREQRPTLPAKEIITERSSYQRASLHKPTAKPITPYERKTMERSSTQGSGSRVHGPGKILVRPNQNKNPLLTESRMKIMPWGFDSTILSDYYISPTFQILFLSLKYHEIHPEYIEEKWKKFNKGSTIREGRSTDKALRVLLVLVDVTNHQEVLRKLLVFCMKVGLSLILAWSFEEAGNYIAAAKMIDDAPGKSKKSIEGTKGTDYNTCVTQAFTGIKLINKRDVENLLVNCKSVKQIVLQSCRGNTDDDPGLSNIHGLGSTKLNNLKQVFQEPFIANKDYNK